VKVCRAPLRIGLVPQAAASAGSLIDSRAMIRQRRHSARFLRFPALAIAALLVAGCARAPGPGFALETREITPAFLAHRAASDASVSADTLGHVALTFVTRDTAGARDLWIAVSRDGGSTFAEPTRLNARAGGVSSYSESRPIAVFAPGGALAVAWSALRPEPSPEPPGAKPESASPVADLVVRVSADAGVSFGPEVVVNDDASDRKRVFHGFPALAWLPDGALFAAWEDEREHAGEEGEPTTASLFYAVSGDGGAHWSDNRTLTDELCPCCRSAALVEPGGRLAVAWRTARGNLRDPVIAHSSDGGRTFAPESTVSADRWEIAGCPAVGPGIAFDRAGGGVFAWYTGADTAGVYIRTWRAGGAATPRRSLEDGLAGASHPRVVALDAAMLFAVEATPKRAGNRTHALAVRALMADGTMLPWSFVGENVDGGWLAATGPRTALACWTDRVAHEVELARITLHKTR
jgi:hypothetical protein